jgi:hypothetical protein
MSIVEENNLHKIIKYIQMKMEKIQILSFPMKIPIAPKKKQIKGTNTQYISKTLHYVTSFSERIPSNNDIESNKIISSLNYNRNNFICSFNLNIFDISPLKLNSSLEENVHILNKESQNINNTGKKNVNEKTCSYFEDIKKSSGIATKKNYTNNERQIKR